MLTRQDWNQRGAKVQRTLACFPYLGVPRAVEEGRGIAFQEALLESEDLGSVDFERSKI